MINYPSKVMSSRSLLGPVPSVDHQLFTSATVRTRVCDCSHNTRLSMGPVSDIITTYHKPGHNSEFYGLPPRWSLQRLNWPLCRIASILAISCQYFIVGGKAATVSLCNYNSLLLVALDDNQISLTFVCVL